MKKYDERKVVTMLNRINGISVSNGKITAKLNAVIGIHQWGKIDYLTKYCGYVLVREN